MSKYKPGYKTSEFWFTMVTFLFSGLYLLGVISDNSQKEELIGNVGHAVESCILISGQLAILWKYINSRKEVKKSWWLTQVPESTPPVQNEPKIVEEVINDDGNTTTNVERGTSKTRNRKNSTKNQRKSKSSKKRSNK